MVRKAGSAPERGDVVYLDFDPQAGHEQSGRRPALVISPQSYNEKVGLCLFCPITNRVKGFPFEVNIPKGLNVTGVILSDHIKSLDWRARNATFLCRIPAPVLEEVLAKVRLLIDT